MKLSIIIPVYNEKETLPILISRVEAVAYEKEIVLIDDFSTDGTRDLLQEYSGSAGFKVLFHKKNRGKGAARRTGFAEASRDIIIQDADLAAMSSTSDPANGIWTFFDTVLNPIFPGITVVDGAGNRYAYLNGTSMASPHAAGVAALVVQMHPRWSPDAVKAAVQRSAQHLDCTADWQPLSPADERERCYGNGGRTSFFGHGLVDALAAANS